MLFSNHPRTVYGKSPVHEVICQLRFPTILSINSTEPDAFQEAVRSAFPQYIKRQDAAPPQITGLGGPNPQLQQQPPVTNYHFISGDNLWKLNLTQNFIALSTLRYPTWAEFSRQLDKPLAEFIRLYQPAYFDRLGLRYVNLFSRKTLGVEKSRWSDLIAPAYAGPLCEPDVQEGNLLNCGVDLHLKLDSSCQAKIHAGPGLVKPKDAETPPDPEVKFILDMDLSMNGHLPCTLTAGALETLHAHATGLFEGALTDTLRSAMEPRE